VQLSHSSLLQVPSCTAPNAARSVWLYSIGLRVRGPSGPAPSDILSAKGEWRQGPERQRGKRTAPAVRIPERFTRGSTTRMSRTAHWVTDTQIPRLLVW